MLHSHQNARTQRHAAFRAAVALGLVTALSGCGGMSTWRGLDSIHQPVVERTESSIDLATGPSGLASGERERLAGWFEALGLRYGDRIAVDDPLASDATHDAVQAAAAKFGLLVGKDAPVVEGRVGPGTARVVVTRHVATVPGCPDWSSNSETNFMSGTHSNYGCATNANMAAMVANPEELLRGAHGGGLSNVRTTDKAIGVFQEKTPTGASGLTSNSSKGS